MKALLKYPGAKWRLAPWIISHFPDHHSYLEPFFGSGAVLFNKLPSHIETVNDLDSEVINFFDCVRNDPERLARSVCLTPYSREAYGQAFDALQNPPEDPFERARLFCVRLCQGHGFRTCGEKVGWKNDVRGRERAYAVRDWRGLPDRVIQAAERLRDVQIEHMPAIDLIHRFNYPNVLIYADPPYVLGTRNRKQYRHEMSDEDHEELLDALLAHQGPVILSGYNCPLYDERLKDWHREDAAAYTINSQ